ncbi:MAG: hypothetical protein ACKOVA_15725 [Novosphingobium sp.]
MRGPHGFDSLDELDSIGSHQLVDRNFNGIVIQSDGAQSGDEVCNIALMPVGQVP